MNTGRILLVLALNSLWCLNGVLAEEGKTRTWTAADGRTLEAELLSATPEAVTVRRTDGQRFDLPLSGLSEADQAWVKQRLADQARSKGLEEGPFADKITGEWVKVPAEEYGLVFQLYGTRELSRLDEPFPLFVHLHGAGGRAADVEAGKVEITAQRLAREEQYDETPCLIAVPLCPPDTFWGAHVEKLEKIIDTLVDSLPIDRDRIYLSGYSMGSRGIGSLLESRPKFYAAAMFADGEAKPEWVEKVDAALWFWYSGERDLAGAEAVAKAYVAAGKTAHFEGYPDFTHNQISWQLAHDEEVFPWMFAQRRKAAN